MKTRKPTHGPAVTTRPTPSLWDRVIRGLAWALVATGLAVLGTILITGEREASYADLRAAVADGRVDEVRVEGGLSGEAIGASSAVVHWRDGLTRHVTSVTEASSRREAGRAGAGGPIVEGRVDDELTQLSPDLHTRRTSDLLLRHSEIGPWRVPSWTRPTLVLMYIGILGLLIGGPTPWRATRWAWFWLLALVPPLGGLAFLLLGGSTAVLPPARLEKRLTGGSAFLLTIVASLALSAVGAALL